MPIPKAAPPTPRYGRRLSAACGAQGHDERDITQNKPRDVLHGSPCYARSALLGVAVRLAPSGGPGQGVVGHPHVQNTEVTAATDMDNDSRVSSPQGFRHRQGGVTCRAVRVASTRFRLSRRNRGVLGAETGLRGSHAIVAQATHAAMS